MRLCLSAMMMLILGLASPSGAQSVSRDKAVSITSIDQIAVSGHAMIFDAQFRRIELEPRSFALVQNSLRARLKQADLRMDERTVTFVRRAEALLSKTQNPDDRLWINAAILNRQLAVADELLRMRYDWRNRVVYEQARSWHAARIRDYKVRPEIWRLLIDGGLVITSRPETKYMAECRSQQVPVPPNFRAASGFGWTKQGDLSTNLLDPGQQAGVWTWTDPKKRGACVALPRRNGGPASFAGIICQSASTARACFWDNLTRADPGRRIPTATETMVIDQLLDGRTLIESQPCTECHTGNNVFLMSPDDATWRKLIKGPMAGPRPGTFTTIVEPQTDTPGGPRYVPVAHPSWTNPPLANGCSGPCHGSPSPSTLAIWSGHPAPPAMPPACRNPGNTYKNCYGTP